jgi:hypothetical protein
MFVNTKESSMGIAGKSIAGAGNFTVMFGETLLKDVKKETFGRKPVVNGKTIDCNHPAWVYGHLAIYASKVCDMTGIPQGPTAVPAGWDELFKNGTPCNDDPTGTTYPAMETITSHFLNGYKYVISKLPEVDDAVFAKPNPGSGRFVEMAPTVGAACAFMLSGHPMSHLGQVSTWRRCQGLGSAM